MAAAGKHVACGLIGRFASRVKDDVPLPVQLGILCDLIVDHFIGAEFSGKVEVFAAGNGGDVRTIRLGDLDCKRSNAATGTVDQHKVALLDVADVAQRLQSRGAG